MPLSRPFGLTAPAMFSGTVLMDGKPTSAASVRMARINTEKRTVPTSWHEISPPAPTTRANFPLCLTSPAGGAVWQVFPVTHSKGPDGQPKPLQMGAMFWLYVDSLSVRRASVRRKQRDLIEDPRLWLNVAGDFYVMGLRGEGCDA